MSSESYGCGPFDRCVGSCLSEGFNYCQCYDESDQEAYWGDSCLEPSSDSRADLSEAFLAAGSMSPDAWGSRVCRAGLSEAFLAAGRKSPEASGDWDGSGGVSEAFLASGSKSPEKIWDDWDGSGGVSEAFLALGSKSPEKIWDDWDGSGGVSEAFLASGSKSPEKIWDGSGSVSEAFLASGSKSPEKIWDDWDGSGGVSEAFLASGSKSPEKIWDDWDGSGSVSEAFLASGSKSPEKIWDDWDGSGGVSEAFLASGSKSPEKIWDDWADGATSNSTAIPRAPAVVSTPKEWGVSGGSTSHSMSIPPSSTLADVTLADGGRAFDCSACCLPLKPPIFQCDQGHAVCLTCLKALSWEGSAAAARCNVSGGHGTDGYRQNQPLENAVEAIRVTCPNAAYGCTDLLTRYFLPTHRRSCSYALTASCPRDACSFIGSVEALLDHFIIVENWPFTAETQPGKSFDIRLSGGFNVVSAVRGSRQHLLVLFVARRPFGSTVSAICISPEPKDISWLRPPPQALKCELELHFLATPNSQTSKHDVITSFDVPCTNPLDGLPDPDDFFQFSVPKSVHPDDNAAIKVTASITLFYPEA